MKKLKEKQCRHCGTKENLRTNKNGVLYNCCVDCYKTIEVPDQIKKTKTALKEKYGVSDLGELRKKRLIEHPPEEKEKPLVYCKYCNSPKVITKVGKKRTMTYPVCKDHWELYQQEKSEVRKQSNLEKYGADHPMHIKEFKDKQYQTLNNRTEEEQSVINEKRVATNIKKYGVTHPIQLDKFKEKRVENFKEKYGVENPMQLDVFKNKQNQTLMKTYGVTSPLKSDVIKKRVINTNIKKYGGKCPLNDEEVKDKADATLFKNFGVSSPMYSDVIKNKVVTTNIERYKVTCSLLNEEVITKATLTKKLNYWKKFNENLKEKKLKPLFTKEYYTDPSTTTYKYQCDRCGKTFETKDFVTQKIWCGCLKARSKYEDEIIDWLASIGILNVIANEKFYDNKKMKYEVDVYLPDYNLGIEFHGLYWHSTLYVSKDYHQNKYKYFKEKNIKLIQVFENEWIDKPSIVKSIISSKLGLNDTLYARKCKLEEIPNKVYNDFLETNHLQGATRAILKIGLFYKGELVSVGSFGRNRFEKEDNTVELIRFSNLKNTTVVGGFQKILKYVENKYHPKVISSYVDVRYFDGKGYISAGFIEEYLTKPNYYYYYVNGGLELHNRMKFQKHKLSKLLDNFNPLLSEEENMFNNKYLKIYDAGNLKMTKNLV